MPITNRFRIWRRIGLGRHCTSRRAELLSEQDHQVNLGERRLRNAAFQQSNIPMRVWPHGAK